MTYQDDLAVRQIELTNAKLETEKRKLDADIAKLDRESGMAAFLPLTLSLASTLLAALGLAISSYNQSALVHIQAMDRERLQKVAEQDAFRSALQLSTASEGTIDQRLAGMQQLQPYLLDLDLQGVVVTGLTSTMGADAQGGGGRLRCAAADILAGALRSAYAENPKSVIAAKLKIGLFGVAGSSAGSVPSLNTRFWTQSTFDPNIQKPKTPIDLRLCTGSIATTTQAVSLAGPHLDQTDLSRANLAFARLANANLEGADLHDSDLHGADLSNAKVTGAIFDGANLEGANLTGIKGYESASFKRTNIRGIIPLPIGRAIGAATSKHGIRNAAVDQSSSDWIAKSEFAPGAVSSAPIPPAVSAISPIR